MGQGGYITLVNYTDYDWKLSDVSQYQMDAWSFPTEIKAGGISTNYVEWCESIFHNKDDDQGWASYTLQTPGGTDNVTFKIHAQANPFRLQIVFDNFSTPGNATGSVLDLGWNHDGYVSFVLSGNKSNYWATAPNAATWMADSASVSGGKSIKNICMPGSHDSGMSVSTSQTAFAYDCNTITQTQNIEGQLNLGARYFDIRPVIGGGQYFTGHYGQIEKAGITTMQGARGQSIDDIVNEVNSFMNGKRELLILNLSHDMDTDAGNSGYPPFTDVQWDALLTKLLAINDRYKTATFDDETLLAHKTYNDLTSSAGGAVCIVVPDHVSLKNYQGQGFWPLSQINPYNSYSDTNNYDTMSADQIAKMKAQKATGAYFLLSWTLTQSDTQAVGCGIDPTGSTNSILDLATYADQRLALGLIPSVTKTDYPNIIYIDDYTNSNAAALAMAINYKIIG